VMHRARLDEEPDGRALFAIDLDVGESGTTDEVDPGRGNEATRDSDRFDRLIQGPGANGLDLNDAALSDDSGECAGHGVRTRFARDFQDFHWCLLAAMLLRDALRIGSDLWRD